MQVTKLANSDRHWAVPTSNYPGPPIVYPTQRFVTIDWDMRVSGDAGVKQLRALFRRRFERPDVRFRREYWARWVSRPVPGWCFIRSHKPDFCGYRYVRSV